MPPPAGALTSGMTLRFHIAKKQGFIQETRLVAWHGYFPLSFLLLVGCVELSDEII